MEAFDWLKKIDGTDTATSVNFLIEQVCYKTDYVHLYMFFELQQYMLRTHHSIHLLL